MVKTAYSPLDNTWHLNWPDRLKQHDLVFRMPPDDPTQGLAIGTGAIGGLVWLEDSKLIMAINRDDAFDDREDEEFNFYAEHNSTLRHCGRLTLDFSVPVFNSWYQKDFNARLNLDEATARIKACTPFSGVDVLAYGSCHQDVLVLVCQIENSEAVPVTIGLERWGSRMFTRWYSSMEDDPTAGLDGTQTSVDDDVILIRQKLRTLDFVTALMVDRVHTAGKKLHSRAGRLETEAATHTQFVLYLTVVTSESAEDPEDAARQRLMAAREAGEAVIRRRHIAEWKSFWEASFISIPDNYLENIWHFILYLNQSSSRGRYPPHFINGLWNFNQDFMPWANYFHWNMQNYTWSLHPGNHAELAMPYLNYRFRQLPHAMRYARQFKGKKGAFYADVADRRGYNSKQVGNNNTPGSQIALLFWKHYRYTGDSDFLAEKAWPVIREAARFYADMAELESDGFYHIHNTQTYEGSPLFDDAITDLAMMKALFPVALEAAGLVGYADEELALWRDIVSRCVDFRTVPLEEEEYEVRDGVKYLAAGVGKGQPCLSDMVFAGGKYRTLEGVDEQSDSTEGVPDYVANGVKGSSRGSYLRCRYAHKDGYYGIPDPELAVVFPSGVIGLRDRQSEAFRTAVNQVRIHPPTDPGQNEAGGMNLAAKLCHGWCPYPVVLARLGLADELATELRSLVSVYQCYPNGFGQWGPFPGFINDRDQRWGKWWKFRHLGNETLNVVCAALDEMLLQSHEPAIRLCPAVPRDWPVSFRLAAEGGFIVNLEQAEGQVQWACLESRLGNPCALVVPWPDADIVYVTVISEQGDAVKEMILTVQTDRDDRIIRFPTQKGCRYLVSEREREIELRELEARSFSPNQDFKTLGYASLGLKKLY
jgi:hypothetical protein